MSIHTIGDSHSGNGWSGIIQHHLGPVLCYSFGKEKLNRCDIRNFNIKDGDTVSGYPVEPVAKDYRLAEVDAVESNQKFNTEAGFTNDKMIALIPDLIELKDSIISQICSELFKKTSKYL